MLVKRTMRRLFSKYWSEIIIIAVFVGIASTAAYFVPWSGIPVFIQTFTATFSGVFLSFLLLHCMEARKGRRAAGNALAAIWLELRHNSKIIGDIKDNFTFPEKGADMLPFIRNKLSSLRMITNTLEDKSFYTGYQSGAFLETRKDAVYNSVHIAYYGLKLLQTTLLTSELSLLHFVSIPSLQIDMNVKKYIEKSINDHIDKCNEEIKISLGHVQKATRQVATVLKERYKVSVGEEPRT